MNFKVGDKVVFDTEAAPQSYKEKSWGEEYEEFMQSGLKASIIMVNGGNVRLKTVLSSGNIFEFTMFEEEVNYLKLVKEKDNIITPDSKFEFEFSLDELIYLFKVVGAAGSTPDGLKIYNQFRDIFEKACPALEGNKLVTWSPENIKTVVLEKHWNKRLIEERINSLKQDLLKAEKALENI